MTALRTLEARFIRFDERPARATFLKPGRNPNGEGHPWTDADFEERDFIQQYHVRVASLGEADGVWFLCPKCFAANGGNRGTHGIICWFVGRVRDDVEPNPGRWNPSGIGLDDLTFVPPGAVSVLLTGPSGCQWHGFVRNGDAT